MIQRYAVAAKLFNTEAFVIGAVGIKMAVLGNCSMHCSTSSIRGVGPIDANFARMHGGFAAVMTAEQEKTLAATVEECARIRRRHSPDQIMDRPGRLIPVDAAVFRLAAAEITALSKIQAVWVLCFRSAAMANSDPAAFLRPG